MPTKSAIYVSKTFKVVNFAEENSVLLLMINWYSSRIGVGMVACSSEKTLLGGTLLEGKSKKKLECYF